MAARRYSQCAVCTHPLFPRIEAMLAEGIPYREVRRWALHECPEVPFSDSSMYRHSKHRTPLRKEIHIPEGEEKPSKETMAAARKLIGHAEMLTVTEFCDLVIAQATKAMVSDQLNPTVADANKAAEIKSRLNEGNRATDQFVEFIRSIANKTGVIGPSKN